MLVGGFNPLKNMKISWDHFPNIWKNKKCSKPPTRYGDDPGKIIELNRDFHGDIIELGGFSIAIFDDRSPC